MAYQLITESDMGTIVCSEKESMIINYRHGLNDGITHTLEETGKLFGLTRERIRQIEAKVLERIRLAKK